VKFGGHNDMERLLILQCRITGLILMPRRGGGFSQTLQYTLLLSNVQALLSSSRVIRLHMRE
jgi:hypothetical protein